MSAAATETQRDRSGLITGALSVVVGAIVLVYAAGMPEIRPGIPGPGLFPMLIAGFLVGFGILLAAFSWFGAKPKALNTAPVTDLAERNADQDQVGTVGVTAGPLATSQRSALINALAFISAIIFYLVAAEILGFVITMSLIAIGLMLLLRVKPSVAIVIGLATAFALWGLFEKLLLVQLPNGFTGIF